MPSPVLTLSAAADHGILGIFTYWAMWIMDLVPIGFFAYSIYLAYLLGHGYWLDSVGGGALACCIIALILQIGSAVVHIFYQFTLFSISSTIWRYIFFGVTVVALVVNAVLLTFFSPTDYQRGLSQLYEHTITNNQTDTSAAHYYGTIQNGDSHVLNRMAFEKGYLPKGPVVSFFILWIGYFLMYIVGITYISEESPSIQTDLGAIPEHPMPNDNLSDQDEIYQSSNQN